MRLLILALLVAFTGQAHAVLLLDAPASANIQNNGTNNVSGSIGFQFELDAGTYSLNSLMFWDGPDDGAGAVGDGLDDGVRVRLWKNGTELHSEFLNGASTVVGEFATTPVTGVTFTSAGAGDTFVLSGHVTAGDNAFFFGTPIGQATFLSDLQEISLQTPNDTIIPSVLGNAGDAFFGPNADVTQVPEPGSWLMLGLVGVGAAGRRWKRALGA